MFLSCLQLFEMTRNLQVLQFSPLAKIWSTVKGNISTLRFSDPGAVCVDTSSVPAILLDLQHPCLLQSRSPCPAIPSTTVLLLVSCTDQDRGHFVALLLIAPTLLGMMPVPSRRYPASCSLLNFHLFTALFLLVTLNCSHDTQSTSICQNFYSKDTWPNSPLTSGWKVGKNTPLNLSATTEARCHLPLTSFATVPLPGEGGSRITVAPAGVSVIDLRSNLVMEN